MPFTEIFILEIIMATDGAVSPYRARADGVAGNVLFICVVVG